MTILYTHRNINLRATHHKLAPFLSVINLLMSPSHCIYKLDY